MNTKLSCKIRSYFCYAVFKDAKKNVSKSVLRSDFQLPTTSVKGLIAISTKYVVVGKETLFVYMNITLGSYELACWLFCELKNSWTFFPQLHSIANLYSVVLFPGRYIPSLISILKDRIKVYSGKMMNRYIYIYHYYMVSS